MSKSGPKNREDLPYRAGVGIVLFDTKGRVFMARRIDTEPEAWQFPQGGIDEGEEPRQAALRELKEEIGTNNAEFVAETDWIAYDLPDELVGKVWKGRYRGQRQKWYAMAFKGTEAEIDIATEHPEFSAWRWADLAEAPALIVPFKRELYREITAAFAALPKRIATSS